MPRVSRISKGKVSLKPVVTTLITSAIGFFPAVVSAQTGTLFLPPATTSGDTYDRGHNVSVTERPKPEYDALGVRLGSFIVAPQFATSIGFSNNVFNDDRNRRADAYLELEPYLSVTSDWSVHQLRLLTTGNLRRFATQPLRNQNAFLVDASGRVDATSDLSLQFNSQIERTYESPYSADVVANLRVPSRYLRTYVAATSNYVGGRSRLIGTLNRSAFKFSDVQFADGSRRDQRYRDRVTYAGSAAYELGFTPSLSYYARLELDHNSYSALAFGLPNRDSTGVRAIAGVNFDGTGIARGTVAVGYSARRFKANQIYPNASGISVEARADLFPDELTTVGLLLRRRLVDVDLTNVGTYWDNVIRATVDHELLYNLIVTASVETAKRDYSERAAVTRVSRVEVSGRYQATRWLGFGAELGYGSTRPRGTNFGNPFSELRGRILIRIRR